MPVSRGTPRFFPACVRIAALCLLACSLAAGATGCAAFDRALGQRWIVVDFQQGTSVPQMLTTLNACSHIRNVVPEKPQTARQQARLDGEVQYTISKASDAQVSLLQTCLTRFSSVVGVNIEDTGDDE